MSINSKKEVLKFTYSLETILESGIKITKGIKISMAQAKKGKFRDALELIYKEILSGKELYQALGAFPQYFDRTYIGLVQGGEYSGTLAQTFKRLSLILEKRMEMREKIKKAMLYPIIVTFVAFAIISFILLYIMPKFLKLFQGNKVELPKLTQKLLHLSNFFNDNILLIGSFLFFLMVFFIIIFRTPRWLFFFHKITLKLPIIGKFIRDIEIIRFTQGLALLLRSGVNIIKALEIVEASIKNTIIQKELKKVRKSLHSGIPLSKALENTKNFSLLTIQIIKLGEETGALTKLLTHLGNTLDRELENTIGNFIILLEPTIIIFLAINIGVVVLALFLPIMELSQTIN